MTQNRYHQSTRSLQTTPRIMRLLELRAADAQARRAANGHAAREAAQVLQTQMTILRIARQGHHISEVEASEIEALLRAGLPYAVARERVRVASLAVLTHPEDRPPDAPAPAAGETHETQEAKNDTAPEL